MIEDTANFRELAPPRGRRSGDDVMNCFAGSKAVGRAGALVLLVLATLAGCAGRSSSLPYAPASFNTPPDQVLAENPDYRLGPTDVVGVTVFRAPEVTGDYRVDESGHIQMPLIGPTRVQGMTTTELAASLRQSLGSRYYVDPDVTVTLREAGSQRITVDGSVNRPGVYPVPGPTTLMQAVAMASGATQDANLRRVVVFRQIDGQRMVAAFDLRAIRNAEMDDPAVYASDIIVVDGSQTRQMLRDIISTVPILALFRPVF